MLEYDNNYSIFLFRYLNLFSAGVRNSKYDNHKIKFKFENTQIFMVHKDFKLIYFFQNAAGNWLYHEY